MKDRIFLHVRTRSIVSAYEIAKDSYLELWREAKRIGDIPEDSSDFLKPILPSKKELIEHGIEFLENNGDYEEVK